jgi:type III secretion protein U
VKEKIYKPTPKKLRDARKKGQVPKSKEIATCAAIVVLFGFLWIFSGYYISHLSKIILIPAAYYKSNFSWAYIECVKKVTKELIVLSIPFALCATVVTVMSYMLQFGVLFAYEPVKPDFKRINPVEGFKRIFSWKSLLELIKSVLKIVLLGSILYSIIKANIPLLVTIPNIGSKAIMSALFTIVGRLIIYVSCVFIFFAIIDYFFEKKLFLHKMKMNADDIRQEYKDREGDPQIKSHRRQIQRKFVVSEDVMTRIEKSTFIIVDGNKIAIAIYYEQGKTKLPIIHAKCRYFLAKRIIEIARQNKKPILQDKYLAKKLYKKGREGGYIHGDLIEPVAKLLRSLMMA